jgi:hypothetical protein
MSSGQMRPLRSFVVERCGTRVVFVVLEGRPGQLSRRANERQFAPLIQSVTAAAEPFSLSHLKMRAW